MERPRSVLLQLEDLGASTGVVANVSFGDATREVVLEPVIHESEHGLFSSIGFQLDMALEDDDDDQDDYDDDHDDDDDDQDDYDDDHDDDDQDDDE